MKSRPSRPAADASPPRALRTAAVLLWAEGAALVGLGLFYGVKALADQPEDRLGAELGALLTLLAGVALVVLGRALTSARAWSRSPVIVLQLLSVPVGIGLLQGSWLTLLGVAVLAVAVAVLGLLATSTARTAFDR